MLQIKSAFDDFANYVASMDAAKIIAFKASDENQKRLDFLLVKNRTTRLTEDETKELENFLMLDRIVGLAKAKAYKMIQK